MAGRPVEVACYATGAPDELARAIERLRAAGAELPPLRLAGEMVI
jgi:hypothetical protein